MSAYAACLPLRQPTACSHPANDAQERRADPGAFRHRGDGRHGQAPAPAGRGGVLEQGALAPSPPRPCVVITSVCRVCRPAPCATVLPRSSATSLSPSLAAATPRVRRRRSSLSSRPRWAPRTCDALFAHARARPRCTCLCARTSSARPRSWRSACSPTPRSRCCGTRYGLCRASAPVARVLNHACAGLRASLWRRKAAALAEHPELEDGPEGGAGGRWSLLRHRSRGTPSSRSALPRAAGPLTGHPRAQPNTSFLKNDKGEHQIEVNPETGYVKIKPGTSYTNVDGVFAAGDIHDIRYRQVDRASCGAARPHAVYPGHHCRRRGLRRCAGLRALA